MPPSRLSILFSMNSREQCENYIQFSRYQHFGAAGSAAHVNGVIQVKRRVQIDELTKAIDSLKDSWSDLYPETNIETFRRNVSTKGKIL